MERNTECKNESTDKNTSKSRSSVNRKNIPPKKYKECPVSCILINKIKNYNKGKRILRR